MEERLLAPAKWLWPELETMKGQDRTSGVFDVVGFLYSAPLVLAGLVWLMAVTDLALIRAEWPTLALLFVLQLLFERLDFFLFVEVSPGTLSSWQSSLGPVLVWSAALIFGPSALWLFVSWRFLWFARTWLTASPTRWRWRCIRILTFNLACVTFASLIALALYEDWASSSAAGRAFPLYGLTLGIVVPALVATFVWWLLSTVIWVSLFIHSASSRGLRGRSLRMYVRFWAITTGSHFLVDPFAVLAAGLYTQNGLGVYLSFVAGLLLATFVAHQLSQAVERSQQRSRELEELEQSGRATLKPARETSGDFYDVIPLSNGRFGIVVADVADKGVGAALHMALSRTLIRTYAADYDGRPDKVLAATNRRILMDARAGLSVTVFYSILDPAAGTLTYCSAGHPPPYLMSMEKRGVAQVLGGNGLALGMLEKATWENQVVQVAPDTALLLYTDGVVDAQNQHQEFFGRERMLASALANVDSSAWRGKCAQGIQEAVVTELHDFVGGAPQFDDITLMVVVRG